MKNYFTDCHSLEELQQEYAKVSKQLHKVIEHDLDELKIAVFQYEEALKTGYQGTVKTTVATPVKATKIDKKPEKIHTNLEAIDPKDFDFKAVGTEFKKVYNKAIKIKDIQIDLIGTWMWVSGSTKEHKDELKALGFHWAGRKQKWYYGKKTTPKETTQKASTKKNNKAVQQTLTN